MVNTKDGLGLPLPQGRQVCCSRGDLPDRRPKPEADGTCASYTTSEEDKCMSIAASYDLTVKLCVGEGSPPTTKAVSNAVCGPTVPGCRRKGQIWPSLIPVPLEPAVIAGDSELLDDLCVEVKSESGAPGMSNIKNGCNYIWAAI